MPPLTFCSRAFLLLFVVSLTMAAAGCRTKPLVDPRPIAATGTPAQTRAAILRALKIDRHWSVVSEQPSEVVARFADRDWFMLIAIAYSNEVSVRYLSSEGIDYAIANGVPVIHEGYNERVQQLSNWIAREIAIAHVSSELPDVPPPPLGEVEPD